MTVTIALGANLGDRHATLARARTLITDRIGPVTAVSGLVETAAWGVTDQPDFLNQVIVVDYQEAGADPDKVRGERAGAPQRLRAKLHHLLRLTQAIEQELGRERKSYWGPRTCDLDLIFVDDLRFESDRLSLPHPWWSVRDFVGGIIRRELSFVLRPR